jgi:hypothetical protein
MTLAAVGSVGRLVGVRLILRQEAAATQFGLPDTTAWCRGGVALAFSSWVNHGSAGTAQVSLAVMVLSETWCKCDARWRDSEV